MTEIVVPTLGESVTEATVAKWLKQPGEIRLSMTRWSSWRRTRSRPR